MMIDVKATRAEQTASRQEAERYQFADEAEQSRKPFVLGALLACIVVYLRSIYPAQAATAPATPEDEPAPKAAPVAPSGDETKSADAPEPPGAEATRGAEGREAASEAEDEADKVAKLVRFDALRLEVSSTKSFNIVTPTSLDMTAPSFENDNWSGAAEFGVRQTPAQPSGGSSGTGGADTGGGAEEGPKARNRAPVTVGPLQLRDVGSGLLAVFTLSDLLRNAIDLDGDSITVTDVAVSSGKLTLTSLGWTFQSEALGPVTITYRLSDGLASAAQSAQFNVVARQPIIGTGGNDDLAGTMLADEMSGRLGNDNLDGRDGNDTIAGEGGNDLIHGGLGDDLLSGGEGNDVLFGGAGQDRLSGGAGNDRLFGNDGNDILHGDAGDDDLTGDAGNDVLVGGEGADRVDGGLGDDTIVGDLDQAADQLDGGAGLDILDYSAANSAITIDAANGTAQGAETGTDLISGFERFLTGAGDDVIIGGAAAEVFDAQEGDDRIEAGAGDDSIADGEGRDVIAGGAGDDEVHAAPDGDDDILDGGSGQDTLDYSDCETGVQIDLKSGTATNAEIGSDQIAGFEIIIGGSGADQFVSGDGAAAFRGNGGNDLFQFEAIGGLSPGAQVVQTIFDFTAGDRIKVSKYEIFEEVMDSLEDRFEDAYGNSIASDDLQIRIRHEETDNIRQTLIDVDFDGDDSYEMAISIAGGHVLQVVEYS